MKNISIGTQANVSDSITGLSSVWSAVLRVRCGPTRQNSEKHSEIVRGKMGI